jgi:hypothetical protein
VEVLVSTEYLAFRDAVEQEGGPVRIVLVEDVKYGTSSTEIASWTGMAVLEPYNERLVLEGVVTHQDRKMLIAPVPMSDNTAEQIDMFLTPTKDIHVEIYQSGSVVGADPYDYVCTFVQELGIDRWRGDIATLRWRVAKQGRSARR